MYLLVVTILVGAAAAASSLYRALHMLQLEGYRTERYLRHGWEARSWRTFAPLAVLLATFATGVAAAMAGAAALGVAVVVAGLAQGVAFAWRVWSRPSKVPIKLTARMWRLIAASVALAVALVAAKYSALAFLSSQFLGGVSASLFAYTAAGVIVVCGPLVAVLAAWVLEPLEMALRRGFVDKARRRLDEVAPIVIGVAGSYGKTTTKAALAAALSGRYRVLASPESYNTLLGVTRTINEQLADDTEVLIVEMGARQPGDIEEICRLVRPSVGVITRLGPQHLEYFKSEEAVVRTKTELLRSLPADGLAIVDADGISAFEEPLDWQARTVRVSARADSGAEAIVGDVALSGEGTTFSVTRAGERIDATTRLLGRHAAMNCGLAVVAGLELGLDAATVGAGLRALEPVPHRLQIVRNDSVVVIDDAFSSNPEGFAAALEVLAAIPGRHILITPGMIELGEQTVPAHTRIASIVADVCDVVILVGRMYPPEFMQAMRESGMADDAVSHVESLTAASELLGTMIAAGDVVLFENDLPDNFE